MKPYALYRRLFCVLCVIGMVIGFHRSALAQDAAATQPADAAAPPPVASAPAVESASTNISDPLEAEFSDYLHFALIGQFEIADAHAQALLKRSELEPLSKEGAEKLLALSVKYKNSVDTLQVIIANTPISDNANKILGLINESHKQARMAPSRITDNIKLLAGTPMQQAVAHERLIESGEYAVPWMLAVLGDPQRKNLQPFVVRALPLLGKKAVNPLVEAITIDKPEVQGVIVDVLGRIGYPQALPYLQRLAADAKANVEVRKTAVEAIGKIVVADPSVKKKSAADLFYDLAENYYANIESLRPDPREPKVNVWFLRGGILAPIEVPPEIYRFVMSMRTAKASLALQPEQPKVVALWLAANFKREAALGFDVASEEPVKSADLTRPEDYPRGIYFARTFGPLYSQMALTRAVNDRDPDVALGAIAALNVTAGPATMVQPASPNGSSLAAALYFPDLLVRIRAALALGRSMPQTAFKGSGEVVQVLASALQLTGQKHYLLVEPEAAIRNRLQDDLARMNATVVSAEGLTAALDAARELPHLDGIFLSTDMANPSVIEAIINLPNNQRFALAPIVLLVKQNDNLLADQVNGHDPRIGRVFFVAEEAAQAKLAEQLMAKRDAIAPRFGQRDLPVELGVSLALESARTLRLIAVNRSPVFDIRGAEASLIQALGHPSEDLRIAAAAALALLESPNAQQAIATVALSTEQTESLRKEAFGSLAESARHFGSKLQPAASQKLLEEATGEPNLALRTAASQALGAMNPPSKPVAEIILVQP